MKSTLIIAVLGVALWVANWIKSNPANTSLSAEQMVHMLVIEFETNSDKLGEFKKTRELYGDFVAKIQCENGIKVIYKRTTEEVTLQLVEDNIVMTDRGATGTITSVHNLHGGRSSGSQATWQNRYLLLLSRVVHPLITQSHPYSS